MPSSVYSSEQQKFNTSLRCNHTWRSASPRFPQPRTRGHIQCSSFYHSTPEIPPNHHHSVMITKPTCHEAHTSTPRLRDHVPHLTWKDLKDELSGSIQQYPFTVTLPKPLPIYNKVLMSYLECTYTMPVNFCQNFIIQWTCSQI